MGGYDWNFAVLTPYLGAFARGAGITILLSIGAFTIGTSVGTVLGIIGRGVPGARIFFLVNDCVRAVPPLVLLFIAYYFPFNQLIGIPAPSPFWASLIAFAVAQAAYSADITRSAVENVPRDTILSGLALGLKPFALWRFVIIPDIVRQMLPAQIAFFIGIVRLSNLASVIGCKDVVFVSRVIAAETFRSFEPWLLVALIYIIIVVPLTSFAREIERSDWLRRRF